jgi:hypothetical protein
MCAARTTLHVQNPQALRLDGPAALDMTNSSLKSLASMGSSLRQLALIGLTLRESDVGAALAQLPMLQVSKYESLWLQAY